MRPQPTTPTVRTAVLIDASVLELESVRAALLAASRLRHPMLRRPTGSRGVNDYGALAAERREPRSWARTALPEGSSRPPEARPRRREPPGRAGMRLGRAQAGP